MDINSAEKSMHKLLLYVQSLADSEPNLYDKSKQRLKNIADDCIKSVEIISMILQDELLQDTGEDEFNPQISPELEAQLELLTSEVDKIREFVGVKDSLSIPESKKVEISIEEKVPSKVMRSTIHNYTKILQSCKDNKVSVKQANQCIDLIWKWFNARILTKHTNAPPFYYSIYRIKNIIYAIVVMFGYSVENDEVDEFISMFDNWCDSLDTSKESNKWIAPYKIYQIERKMIKQYANLTSVILWDILVDAGLHKLCDSEDKYDLMIKSEGVWDMIECVDSEVLDNYKNYSEDPSIFNELNLTIIE